MPKFLAWVSLDPGDKWTGWAMGSTLGTPMAEGKKIPKFVTAGTMESGDVPEWLEGTLGRMQDKGYTIGVIREKFHLFPVEMANQSWKEMHTSELIGKIDYICDRRGIPVKKDQDSSILKVTRRQLEARGIKLKGDTIHAECAELHLWYMLLRRGLGQE